MCEIKKIFSPDEMYVYKFQHGIKLLDPEKKNATFMSEKADSLSDLFKLKLSIYLLDHESRLQNCNIENLDLLNTASFKDVYKKSAFDVWQNETCRAMIQNDKNVICYQKKFFFDEQMPTNNGLFIDGLTIKLPWYGAENKVIGVMGFSVVIGKYSLASSLSLIANLGIFDQKNNLPMYLPGLKLGNIYLTKREIEILHHIVRGKSSRLIAEAISRSTRTVQTHIENIKNKMGVDNKAELIEKALESLEYPRSAWTKGSILPS